MDNARTSTRSLTIRDASFDDYSQVVALESKHGLEAKSYEEWKHLWFNNPAYRKYQQSLPIGWVLEDKHKNIVGYLGNIPLFYEFEGRRLLASVAHAWVVDEPYRSYAPLLLERYFSQQIVDLFLNATVGPLASDSFAVYESLPVPVGAWDRSSFWITNYHGFIDGWLTMKGLPSVKPLRYILSVALFAKDAFVQRQLHQRDTGVNVKLCADFDVRFDSFWELLIKINSHRLMGSRTRDALKWHFKYALQQGKAWIATVGKGSDLTAYAIFHRYDNPRFRVRRMRLVDFQTIDENTAVLVPMLIWALERSRRERIDMVESIGFRPDKENVINKIAAFKRKLPCWRYFYKARDKNLAQRLSDPNSWDPSQFDGDASL